MLIQMVIKTENHHHSLGQFVTAPLPSKLAHGIGDE